MSSSDETIEWNRKAALDRLSTPKSERKSYYKPTGFKPGRPRLGEPPRPRRRKYPGQIGRPPKSPERILFELEQKRLSRPQLSADEIIAMAWQKSLENQPKRRGRKPGTHYGKPLPDSAPDRIKKIRAKFCNHFIKTGEIDVKLQAELAAYAKSVRSDKLDRRRTARGTYAKTSSPDHSTNAPAFDRQSPAGP